MGIDASFMGQGYTFYVIISGNVRIDLVKRIQNRCGWRCENDATKIVTTGKTYCMATSSQPDIISTPFHCGKISIFAWFLMLETFCST